METKKRAGSPLIKADPCSKRVKIKSEFKSEDGEAKFDFSTLPPAPFASNSNAQGVAGRTGPTNHQSGYRRRKRKARGYYSAIIVRRGSDQITTHYNRLSGLLEVQVLTCSPSWSWDSDGVEEEIFHRLRNAHFLLEPANGWGFLDVNRSASFMVQQGSYEGRFMCLLNVAVNTVQLPPKPRTQSPRSTSPSSSAFNRTDFHSANSFFTSVEPSAVKDEEAAGGRTDWGGDFVIE